MDTDRCDIFLSYRRGGFETAKHLFDLLTCDGYSVSFDIDTLRSGDFDTALRRRIDRCTDFILILDREAFDRTLDPAFDRNEDWLRIELAYALEKGRNIIPVMSSGFDGFPDNLPADIAAVRRKNGPKYDPCDFDAFYGKLLRFLDSRPSERRRREAYLLQLPDERFKAVKDHGAYGFLDSRNNELLIPFAYDDANSFSEGLAAVKKSGKWGYIDKTGREAIPFIYDDADDANSFSEGLAAVKKGGKRGYIDKTGKVAIPLIYDFADLFSEGLASVEKEDKWGYIDQTGRAVIPLIYDMAYSFSEGLAAVGKGGKRGYIDQAGREAIPFIYDWAWSFSEGLASVKKGGKWGYIDQTGKVAIPLIYDFADSFSEGLASVEKGGKWGYIDRTGKVAIPFAYDEAYCPFREGLARVVKDGKYGYIDKSGRWVKDA